MSEHTDELERIRAEQDGEPLLLPGEPIIYSGLPEVDEAPIESSEPQQPHCLECARRARVESLKGTALWIRLTTPTRILEQLQR